MKNIRQLKWKVIVASVVVSALVIAFAFSFLQIHQFKKDLREDVEKSVFDKEAYNKDMCERLKRIDKEPDKTVPRVAFDRYCKK